MSSRVTRIILPAIHAITSLQRGNPAAAVDELQPTKPYELAMVTWRNRPSTIVAYLRGQAFLQAGAVTDAAAEFQTIIDHRGVDPTSPFYTLSYLGLARAYAGEGEVRKSLEAYDKFFTIWKDADPDVPILLAARREYAKLAGKRK